MDFRNDIFRNLKWILPNNIEHISFSSYTNRLVIYPYRIYVPEKYKFDFIKMVEDLGLKYIHKYYVGLWINPPIEGNDLFRKKIPFWLIKDELHEKV